MEQQQMPTMPFVAAPAPQEQQQPVPANQYKPNNKPFRKTKPNYFKRQVQRLGQEWLAKKTPIDIERDADSILRDFVRGNIFEEDVQYFFDYRFTRPFFAAILNNLREYEFRCKTDNAYVQSLSGSVALDPFEQNLINIDAVRFGAWKDLNALMWTFSSESAKGPDAAIRFMIYNAVPAMRVYNSYNCI